MKKKLELGLHLIQFNHPVRLVVCWCPAGCSWLVLRSRRSSQQQPSSRSCRAAEQGECFGIYIMSFFVTLEDIYLAPSSTTAIRVLMAAKFCNCRAAFEIQKYTTGFGLHDVPKLPFVFPSRGYVKSGRSRAGVTPMILPKPTGGAPSPRR